MCVCVCVPFYTCSYCISVCTGLLVALLVWVPEITHWQINGLSWPSSLLHVALCGWPAHSSNTACLWAYQPNTTDCSVPYRHKKKKHTFTSIKERIRCSSMCLSRAPYLSMIIWSLIWENLILLFVSLSRIFSYLDVVTLCRCAQVSKVSASLSTPHPN